MSFTVRGPLSSPWRPGSEATTERLVSRLSSGLRVARAADDAAGLAISERMRAGQLGAVMAARNVTDGMSLLQVAEGAMGTITALLQRARELSVQAASTGTSTVLDREAIAAEVGQLVAEADRVAGEAAYGTIRLLDGSRAGGLSLHVGAGSLDTLQVPLPGLRAEQLGLTAVGGSTASTSTTTTTVTSTVTTYTTRSGILGTYDATSHPRNRFTVGLDGRSYDVLVAQRVYGPGDEEVLRQQFQSHLDSQGAGIDVTLVGSPGSLQLDFAARSGRTSAITFGGNGAGRLGISTTSTTTTTTTPTTTTAATGTAASSGAALADLVRTGSADAIAACDAALGTVLEARTGVGAAQNALEHRLSLLTTTADQLGVSRSRIVDADLARESVGLVRAQLLDQARTAVQGQSMAASRRVLQLLAA